MSIPHHDADRAAFDVEVLIVGAGISGIWTGIELLRHGQRSFLLLESEQTLGGTWRDNVYPGVAVDVPFISYCFPFETDHPWSRIFPPGAEILGYIQHCARKYGITSHIRYNARVVSAQFDADSDSWICRIADGAVLRSRHLIAATGLLSQPTVPAIEGLHSFAGKRMHTARWDRGHDLTGKRVAVIGTGASAVQIVPEIAGSVATLYVFQRTPIWVAPRPDAPIGRYLAAGLHHVAALRWLLRLLSECSLQALTFCIVTYQRLPFMVTAVQRAVRRFMRAELADPDLETDLIPDYTLGCKRPTTSNTYLSAFRRDNVTLVTDPIVRICPDEVVTASGARYGIDTLVLATGFLTTQQGNAPSFAVIGMDGMELGQFWQENRLQAYAGVAVPGFPNFFLTAGPYSGGFNWFTTLSAHLKHIMACLHRARAEGATRVEVDLEAHRRYMQAMWSEAEGTVFKAPSCASAHSYYLDRHGDASLPLPRTPWWRVCWNLFDRTRDYRFTNNAAP